MSILGLWAASQAGLLSLSLFATPELKSIATRNYAIDGHRTYLVGSSRLVGMGGAFAALGDGSAGMISNPATLAVRPAYAKGFRLDGHLDWLNASPGSDVFNTGSNVLAANRSTLATAGLAFQFKRISLGLGLVGQSMRLTDDSGVVDEAASTQPTTLQASTTEVHLLLAFPIRAFRVGFGIRSGSFDFRYDNESLFSHSGATFQGGVLWMPEHLNMRLGLTGRLRIQQPVTQSELCDPDDCQGFILPDAISFPAIVRLGSAFKLKGSDWNRRREHRYADESNLIVSADVVVAGPVSEGTTLHGFLTQLQQSTQSRPTFSLHAGVESEVIPGWLRLRGGSYFEESRVSGYPGRAHATAGIEVRTLSMKIFVPFRLRLTGTMDVARDFLNLGFSLGFWR